MLLKFFLLDIDMILQFRLFTTLRFGLTLALFSTRVCHMPLIVL